MSKSKNSTPTLPPAADACTIATRKLVAIFVDARGEARTEKMVETVRALGATGSPEAAEALKEIYDRTDPQGDAELQHELIRALGQVGHNAHIHAHN